MKIQNAKIKNQNYNAKLKINKIQTPVIAIYPEASRDEAISFSNFIISSLRVPRNVGGTKQSLRMNYEA